MSQPIWMMPIHEITTEHLLSLKEQDVSENLWLEYKLLTADPRNYISGTSAELPKDVVAFANARGGLIIFGISEHKSKPIGFPGITCEKSLETIRHQMVDSLDYNVKPRLSSIVQFQEVAGPDGKELLLLRVPRSLSAPHMVTNKEPHYFPIRRDTKAAYMDYDELRSSFSTSGSLFQRVAEFQVSRLEKIKQAGTPVPHDLPWFRLVVHLVPIETFENPSALDLGADPGRLDSLAFPGRLHVASEGRYTPDGYLLKRTFGQRPAPHLPHWYLLVHWNGTIEVATDYPPQIADSLGVNLGAVEKEIQDDLQRSLITLNHLGVSPPYLALASILCPTGYLPDPGISGLRFTPVLHPIDREEAILPPQLIEDPSISIDILAKSMINRIWQCFGLESSPNS